MAVLKRPEIYSRTGEILNLYSSGKGIRPISKIIGCNFITLKKILLKNGVKIRPKNSYYPFGKSPANKLVLPESEIVHKYCNENISPYELAEKFYCDVSVIYRILHENKIKMKGNSFFCKGKCPPHRFPKGNLPYSAGKTVHNCEKLRLAVEKAKNTKRRLFLEGKFKPSPGCFKKGDIRITGKNNFNWMGGKSFEPYSPDFSDSFKDRVRNRDNNTCVICGLLGEDSLKLYHRRLEVHHIDYNKLSSIPENCCALCVRCHANTRFNREYWTKFFQSILSERYQYACSY